MPASPPPPRDETEANIKKNKNTTKTTPPPSPPQAMSVEVMGHDWCHGENTGDRRAFPNANLAAQVEIVPRLSRICHHVVLSGSEHLTNDTSASMAMNHPRLSVEQTNQASTSAITSTSTSTFSGEPRATQTSQFAQASVQATVAPFATSRSNNNIEKTSKNMSVENLIPNGGDAIKAPSPKRRKRGSNKAAGQTAGRWTRGEHEAFLAGLQEFGREWKKVATRIPTRTSAQIRSHAQKYFAKLQRDQQQDSLTEQGAAIPDCGQPMTPSAQRHMDRLLLDPHAAQREVESTMEALRERYRQLQLRLAQRQRSRRTLPTNGSSRIIENDRKRPRQMFEDDHSSVSSALSASMASLGNEELIALHVLGGTLPRGDSSTEGLPEDEAEQETKSSDRSTASEDHHGEKKAYS